jgi:hypothetical protein
MRHCLDLLELQAVAITVADESDGGRSAVIASSPMADKVAAYEVEHENGPAADCYRNGIPLAFLDFRTAGGGWPDYSRMAVSAGFGECSCLPLRLDDHVIGVLQLFGALDDIGVRIAGALSDVATIAALTQAQLLEPPILPVQVALQGRLVVEQARGMLAERLRITTADALRLLRGQARAQDRRLAVVAAEVVRDATVRPFTEIAGLIRSDGRVDLGRC